MLKKSFIVIVLGLVLAAPSTSWGQTAPQSSSLQALIQQLQEQIKTLQEQVASLQGQLTTTREEVAEVKAKLNITNSLQRGAIGDEVKELQEFLKKFPDIYPSGLVTGYFGPQTEAAVRKLQERQGIEVVGIVGPKTLTRINALFAEGAGASGVIPPGLLTVPGIQKKLMPEVPPQATSTVLVVPPAPTSTLILATTTPPILVSTGIATTTQAITTTTTTYVPPATTPSVGQTTTQTTQTTITTATTTITVSSTIGSPPPAPSALYIISGGTTPSTGIYYGYSVQVYRDPDGDEVKPTFDWGDGTTFEWTHFMNPPATGGTGAQTSKVWTTAGTFAVKAKVKDATGRESGWGPITQITVSGTTITPPVFTVTSPNGGEQWTMGETRAITWTATGTSVSTVNVELYKSGGLVGMLGYNVANSGSLNWVVSSTVVAGSDYKVRIYNPSSLYSNNFDESNTTFSIVAPPAAPTITVTYPNGGETLGYLGYSFSYNSSGVSRVGFKLLRGSQVIYEKTTSTTAGSPLSFSPFPNNPTWSAYQSGNDYKLRVFDWDNPGVYDDSDNYLSVDVTPPAISALSVSSAANSAVITWITDEPANSQVNYGSTSSNWTLTPIDYAKVTSHSVTLTGLTSSTLYKYRVMSTDGLGNTTQTPTYPSEYTFTTLSAGSGGSATTTTSAISKNNFASILETLSSLLQNLQQLLK